MVNDIACAIELWRLPFVKYPLEQSCDSSGPADLNKATRLELPAVLFAFSAINSVERKKMKVWLMIYYE